MNEERENLIARLRSIQSLVDYMHASEDNADKLEILITESMEIIKQLGMGSPANLIYLKGNVSAHLDNYKMHNSKRYKEIEFEQAKKDTSLILKSILYKIE